jgi:hypothetical protein
MSKTEEFITAVGALAEMSGALRDSLTANGFTRKEACSIVATVISDTLKPSYNTSKDEE